MSMRLKLFISYLIMGFLPVILFIAVICGAIFSVVNSSPFLMSLGQSEEKINQGLDGFFNIEVLTRDNPAGLFDKNKLTTFDRKLSQFHIGIILMDSNKKVFYMSPALDSQNLLEEITAAEQLNPPSNTRMEKPPFSPLGYRKLDLESDYTVFTKALDKGTGTLYLAVETGSTKQMNNAHFRRFAGFIFWFMAGLILLATFLVTRSMMQSLRQLKEGVRHISEGDLNFSVKTDKRDEVAQVVSAFEEMRVRLKNSIDAQVKEDENRKELFANISHDLKTPITAIKGYIEGLIDGVADTPEKKEKYLKTIQGKTMALDRMIDDLFLYSSLDIGRAAYHFETLPAQELFGGLCEETKLDLSERGFEVSCSIHLPPTAVIRADRQMIQRLQHNLTENASKYCRESDRKVTFSAFIQGETVVCSTEDNGIGIKAEEMPHVFERFYRADSARTSTIGGTGLGLQITSRIVEDHGGRIWAESTYGEFTRISWTLPLLQEMGHSLPEEGHSQQEEVRSLPEPGVSQNDQKNSGGGQDA